MRTSRHHGKRTKHKRRHALGAAPGCVTAAADALPSQMRVIAYNEKGVIDRPISAVAEIPELLARWKVCWINVDGLASADIISALGELFDIHNLALEDVVHTHQRPKMEQYDGHVFITAHLIDPGMEIDQFSMFLGKGYVLTFQERPGDCLDALRRRIREARGRVRDGAADYLAYCILDTIIDSYFPYLDDIGDRMEAVETEVLGKPGREVISTIHNLKHDLFTLRRAIAPLRDAVNALIRDTGPEITDTTRVFLRDCYDHTFQILDLVDTQREIAGGLLDIYLSSVSNRMNEVMKLLTIISTVFIPLTFIAGVYGMNFDHTASHWNMPELHWTWGYPAIMAVMLLIALGELGLFWKMGWLRPRQKPVTAPVEQRARIFPDRRLPDCEDPRPEPRMERRSPQQPDRRG
jgi:magnesium transporter